MSKQSIRAFAGGITFSVLIIGGWALFAEPEQPKPFKQLSFAEEVERRGVVTISKSEYEKYENFKKQASATKETTKTSSKHITPVYMTEFRIYSGDQSEDVAHRLQVAKIIKNEQEFIDYVEQNKKSRLIKPGIFHLKADMKIDEIVSIITKK